MSVEGFNRNFRPRRIKSNGDFIIVHFDPDQIDYSVVNEIMNRITNIPERHRGTIFTVEPEGMWFRRI